LTLFVAFGMEGLAIELQDIHRFLKLKLHRNVSEELVPPARRRLQFRRWRLRSSTD
jgi:hypothetical protein